MKNDLAHDVDEWVRFVEMDRGAARHLFKMMHPKSLEIICFHCQQAAEKAIKALFILKEIEVIKIHDLGMLIKIMQPHISFPDTIKLSALRLTKFAATFRYPQYPDIDEELTQKALSDMDVVVDWCKEQIKAGGN